MFRVSLKWLALWTLWAARLMQRPTLPVRVSNGILQGGVSPDGSHAFYLGIPYATVPERFQAPGPEPKWSGVFNAVQEHIHCRQPLMGITVTGQEECLVLNVYTPLNTPSEAKLPVMVFIHGGGFFFGSGARMLYGPEYLVSKGVILVTLNYRLNIQGFLCLGIKEAPGNAGLKDQVAALKWIKRNIKQFGGDPDNITLFGESAGGASVSYHVVSPMSRGLFHKAITQSGSSIGAWSSQTWPVKVASRLAKALGNQTQHDPLTLYKMFMNKTDEELILTKMPIEAGKIFLGQTLFVPCVERKLDGIEPFLTKSAYTYLQNGEFSKVPMIIGTNSEEGYYFVGLESKAVLTNVSFMKSLPDNYDYESADQREQVAEKLKKFYLGDDESSENKVLLSKLYGEPYFNLPSLQLTELIVMSTHEKVYNYFLSYSGWRNFAKFISGMSFFGAPGASHADDLFYLFKIFAVPSLFEDTMIDRMTTLWTNFAKYGNPTLQETKLVPVIWPSVNYKSPQALVLDRALKIQPLWPTESLKYLRDLYAELQRIDVLFDNKNKDVDNYCDI